MDRKNKLLNRDSDSFNINIDHDHDHDHEVESEPVIIKDRRGLVKSVCFALGIHVAFFFVIAWFWQQASVQNQSSLIIPPEAVKINSYIITTEQYEAMIKASELAGKSKAEIDEQEINTQEGDKQNTLTEDETSSQIKPPNDALPVSHLQQQAPAEPKDSHTPDINTPEFQNNNAATINDDTLNAAIVNEGVSDRVNVGNNYRNHSALSTDGITQASNQYLKQMNMNELETLIGSQAALANESDGTMSEMDPDIAFIELIPKIDTSQPHTYNHRLDPNRIVKQGDYCYRVVNLATQVNPYGEGLGYAEFCGVDDQKAALTSAINNRLSKIK